MIIALILLLFAVALFLIFHDDHDDSYTRSEKKPTRKHDPKPAKPAAPQVPQAPQASAPRPARFSESRTFVPESKVYRSGPAVETEKPVLDYHFLDQIEYDASLPERTMSSFIAGIEKLGSDRDLGGIVGWVSRPVGGGLEVHAAPDGRLVGYLPMKDRADYLAFNPTGVVCPFAGHVAVSVTGRLYADVRIVLPSSRDFVEEALVGFLG